MKISKYTMTGSSREFYGTGTNFFRYRYRYFFPGPIFSNTGTGTFFRDQFFPIPVPVLFSGTNFFRYRDRYFFPGPNFPGTGAGLSRKFLPSLAAVRPASRVGRGNEGPSEEAPPTDKDCTCLSDERQLKTVTLLGIQRDDLSHLKVK